VGSSFREDPEAFKKIRKSPDLILDSRFPFCSDLIDSRAGVFFRAFFFGTINDSRHCRRNVTVATIAENEKPAGSDPVTPRLAYPEGDLGLHKRSSS
jgi:hypothetical protein